MAAAACFLPLSVNPKVSRELGTRLAAGAHGSITVDRVTFELLVELPITSQRDFDVRFGLSIAWTP